MELYLILIVYFIILICLIFVFYKYGINIYSSIILSMIICFLLLNILKPPINVNLEEEDSITYFIYILIELLTPIFIFIYAIIMAVKDKYIDTVCGYKQDIFNINLFD